MTAVALCRRQMHSRRQFQVADAAALLQAVQQAPIQGVQFNHEIIIHILLNMCN
jgi:hypothetical protein